MSRLLTIKNEVELSEKKAQSGKVRAVIGEINELFFLQAEAFFVLLPRLGKKIKFREGRGTVFSLLSVKRLRKVADKKTYREEKKLSHKS